MGDGYEIGPVREGDLAALLDLYRHLNPGDPVLDPSGEILAHWRSILANPDVQLLGAYLNDQLVATCVLVLIPNLTRGARPYGLIENVLTHPEHRKRGLGTALLRHALDLAWSRNAYKVMLLTGRRDEAVSRFYEKAGFLAGVKTGFVAYPDL